MKTENPHFDLAKKQFQKSIVNYWNLKYSFYSIAVFFVFTISLLNVNAAKPGALIAFSVIEYDFGKIKEIDGPVKYKFEFTNKGTAPLIINNVEASCGCTTPEWSKKPILPGQKEYILAIYDPKNRPGKFEKNITIYSNDVEGEKILIISGEVIPKGMPTQ